jgi:hypothetical protein
VGPPRAASGFVGRIAVRRGPREGGCSDRSTAFAVDVEPDSQIRRIIVPTGFDAAELQRRVAALESLHIGIEDAARRSY